MASTLWHVSMSVDGFIAGPDDEMGPIFDHVSFRAASGQSEAMQKIIRETGAAVIGRRTYDVGPGTGNDIYGGADIGPKFVLSSHPPDEHPPAFRFRSAPIASIVAEAKEAAGDQNVAIIGASIARQCLAQGLVDELLIFLAPVLIGSGVRLFDEPDGEPIPLTPIARDADGPLTYLRFRVGAP